MKSSEENCSYCQYWVFPLSAYSFYRFDCFVVLISGMGFPVSTGIRVPARTFGKVQTSTAHAVEEWTPCCHRLLTEFLNCRF